MFDVLTEENWMLYAIKFYENPHCVSYDEFVEDIRRIKYIKKLLTRYLETGDLKERLILNHIIILNNVFETTALVRILFLKMEKYLPQIKPFLVLLNILPDQVYNVKIKGLIPTNVIPFDKGISSALGSI